ncbi:MAG: hypothetical protein KDK23_04875 [Leptospiraceae bacterium]|nr:hypothetical protein [Leptospiraceae bacterium]
MNSARTLLRVAIILIAFALFASCSAFQVRHIDETGKTRTYVTDTVFTGTGTILDCVISPFHWAAGLFYLQPYMKANGTNYPNFGASGCFAKAYGDGITDFMGLAPGMLNPKGGPARARFIDINGKEIEISGGTIEIVRVSRRLHFGFN